MTRTPSDTTHVYDFAFLLRENGEVRAVHDRHVCGLFPTDTWCALAREAGFRIEVVSRPLPEEYAGSGYAESMFLAHRER